MQMDIRGRGMVVSEGLSGDVEQRLRAVVERLYPPVRSMRVRIVDDNGPRGGEDKRCVVSAQGGLLHNTVVSGKGLTVMAAVAAAADSLGRKARDRKRPPARSQERPFAHRVTVEASPASHAGGAE